MFLLPTATDDAHGTGQWGAGPMAVGLRQEGPWTYGLLANHLWSFAGEGGRPDVNQTFLQPFLAYNTKTGFGVTLQTESTYNWDAEQWPVPIGLFASQVLKLGGQPFSLQFGPRLYIDGPTGGPEWGYASTLCCYSLSKGMARSASSCPPTAVSGAGAVRESVCPAFSHPSVGHALAQSHHGQR